MNNDVLLTIKNLKLNGFNVQFFNTKEEAKKIILNNIQPEQDVGIGGSMTIFDMNLYKELKNKGNKVYWHWMVSDDKKNEEREKASFTDVYLTSTNAILQSGELLNMDGVGNRVSSMFYGHEKVFIVAGVNKICKNYEKAIDRIKNIACPKNAKRLKLNTPCGIIGKCNNCSSISRMCNIEVIIHKKPRNIDINVLIIDEELGY